MRRFATGDAEDAESAEAERPKAGG
jgi:hypothetical protein